MNKRLDNLWRGSPYTQNPHHNASKHTPANGGRDCSQKLSRYPGGQGARQISASPLGRQQRGQHSVTSIGVREHHKGAFSQPLVNLTRLQTRKPYSFSNGQFYLVFKTGSLAKQLYTPERAEAGRCCTGRAPDTDTGWNGITYMPTRAGPE